MPVILKHFDFIVPQEH